VNLDAIILTVLKILAVPALVLLNGFFVAAEFASSEFGKRNWMHSLAKASAGRKWRCILFATSIRILAQRSSGSPWQAWALATLVSRSLPMLEPVLAPLGVTSPIWQHSISFAVGFAALTFLSIVVGELAPKWLTIQKPLPIALWTARPLRWFYLAFYPFNRLLNLAARWLLEQIGIEPDAVGDRAHSEEELRLVLASAQGTAGGRNIILNALDLRHRVVREVMRPRHEIIAFNTEATIAECLTIAEQTRYSRFPLCEGGDLDKMRGVVHIKKTFMRCGRNPDGGGFVACGAQIDLRSRNRSIGKITPVVS